MMDILISFWQSFYDVYIYQNIMLLISYINFYLLKIISKYQKWKVKEKEGQSRYCLAKLSGWISSSLHGTEGKYNCFSANNNLGLFTV